MTKRKRPNPKDHPDINIPDEDIERDKDAPSFNEALKKVIEKGNNERTSK